MGAPNVTNPGKVGQTVSALSRCPGRALPELRSARCLEESCHTTPCPASSPCLTAPPSPQPPPPPLPPPPLPPPRSRTRPQPCLATHQLFRLRRRKRLLSATAANKAVLDGWPLDECMIRLFSPPLPLVSPLPCPAPASTLSCNSMSSRRLQPSGHAFVNTDVRLLTLGLAAARRLMGEAPTNRGVQSTCMRDRKWREERGVSVALVRSRMVCLRVVGLRGSILALCPRLRPRMTVVRS